MRKRDELNNPAACMMRARDDEMVFVLLGRDESAPDTIRDWIARRIRLGKDRLDDAQMLEAERCARIMEAERGLKVAGSATAPVASILTADQIRDRLNEILETMAWLGTRDRLATATRMIRRLVADLDNPETSDRPRPGASAIDPVNPPPRVDLQRRQMTRCQADEEEPCDWSDCPQIRDGEPKATGRHCPLDFAEGGP